MLYLELVTALRRYEFRQEKGAALSIAAASAAIVRGRLAPRWVGWIGLAVAPLLLLGPFYVPQILLPLWVGVAAFGSWRSGRSDPTLTPT